MSRPAEVRYEAIKLLKLEGNGARMCCDIFEVSCSGFYDWSRIKPSKQEERDNKLRPRIKHIFEKNRGKYGSPRIQKSLENDGEKVGKNMVARIMSEEKLCANKKKAFRPKTTISNPNDRKSARIVKVEECRPEKENKVWVSDITYLPKEKGHCYLVMVMDVFSREIKGWNVSDTMEAENTKKAITDAISEAPGSLEKLVFHSDQGSQYCSTQVRERLNLLKITQSMSRKGNCYDNAYAESFFHTIKNELGKTKFKDVSEARRAVFEYINWYNRERLHSSLGYLSPMDYVRKTKHCVV